VETFVEANHKAILAEISRIPLKEADIKLRSRVVEVLSAERESKGSHVVVKTEKGESFSFDEVLITLPLGFLKRNKEIFKPSLPPRLLAGIDAVSVGHLEKVSLGIPIDSECY
jgi:Flavin containing amine oxidoreductase